MNQPRPEIPFEERSPKAFAHYRELVTKSNRRPVVVEHGYDLTEAESTWDRITACEAEVFGIDPRLLNALLWAHVRYEDLIGLTEVEFEPFRDEERAAYPEWFKGECLYSMEDAIAFMALVCRLPVTQAIAWVCRAKIQQVRSGLIDEPVNQSDWMIAEVR
jgi:hypothetical protein